MTLTQWGKYNIHLSASLISRTTEQISINLVLEVCTEIDCVNLILVCSVLVSDNHYLTWSSRELCHFPNEWLII